jgi:hypothetical protein
VKRSGNEKGSVRIHVDYCRCIEMQKNDITNSDNAEYINDNATVRGGNTKTRYSARVGIKGKKRKKNKK